MLIVFENQILIVQVAYLKKLDERVVVGFQQKPILQIVVEDIFDLLDAVAKGVGVYKKIL